MYKYFILLFISFSYSMSPGATPIILIECNSEVESCENLPDKFDAERHHRKVLTPRVILAENIEDEFYLDDYQIYLVDSNAMSDYIGQYQLMNDSVLISSKGTFKLKNYEHIKLTRVRNFWKEYLKKGIASGVMGAIVSADYGIEYILIGGAIGYLVGNVFQNLLIKSSRHKYIYFSRYRTM